MKRIVTLIKHYNLLFELDGLIIVFYRCIDNEDWRLIKCTICGSRAMHVMCVAKAFAHQRFICPDCGDNDSYESFYRVLVRVGSGTTVGRMLSWQYFSLHRLVHSLKIPRHNPDETDRRNSECCG